MISGAFAYIQNANGGSQSLEPQINPVLLVPLGHSLLLDAHVDFTGFFARKNSTSGPYGGEVFKTIEDAQLDWLAEFSTLQWSAGAISCPSGCITNA